LAGDIPPVEICLLAAPLRCISGINFVLLTKAPRPLRPLLGRCAEAVLHGETRKPAKSKI
jgi:hypothetical protein